MPDQFASAELIAGKWGISRAECDRLALTSAGRSIAAQEAGRFDAQFVPVAGLLADECVRPSSAERLAGLEPLVPGAVHTAATASKIADGASAVLLMSAERAAAEGFTSLATVVDSVLVGVEPDLMLTGPIAATQRLRGRNRSIGEPDVVEVNEAFASVVLAWAAETGMDLDRVNPNGGALAMGHPLGASGTGLICKAVHRNSSASDRAPPS